MKSMTGLTERKRRELSQRVASRSGRSPLILLLEADHTWAQIGLQRHRLSPAGASGLGGRDWREKTAIQALDRTQPGFAAEARPLRNHDP